jgi:hypothetical protein
MYARNHYDHTLSAPGRVDELGISVPLIGHEFIIHEQQVICVWTEHTHRHSKGETRIEFGSSVTKCEVDSLSFRSDAGEGVRGGGDLRTQSEEFPMYSHFALAYDRCKIHLSCLKDVHTDASDAWTNTLLIRPKLDHENSIPSHP